MQINSDGLVFVEFYYKDGSNESVNISAITRIRQQSKDWCKRNEMVWPTVTISVMGMEDDMNIGGLSREKVLNRINKAIKDHYTKILEDEVLT